MFFVEVGRGYDLHEWKDPLQKAEQAEMQSCIHRHSSWCLPRTVSLNDYHLILMFKFSYHSEAGERAFSEYENPLFVRTSACENANQIFVDRYMELIVVRYVI